MLKGLKAAGYDLELGIHLKNLIVFATGQSRFRTVGGLSIDALQSAWRACVPGMEFAMNFMKSNAGIKSPALLSSPFVLVTLAYYANQRGYHLGADEARALRQWVLLANAKARYSRGSSESFLDSDLALIRAGGGPTDLVDRLRLQVGRIDIAPAELEGRNQRSALFKTMFLAFQAAGAVDWRSKVGIDLDHSGALHRLQFHHIFPKAVLRETFTSQEVNDIANLAFISGGTNRKILDAAPSRYLRPIAERDGASLFDAQCIPTDPSLLEVGAYREFLAERRRRVARALNEFLDVRG